MIKNIFAALKYYNANSRDSWVGDCVARSISLALDKPYEEARAELNKVKREYGANAYNIQPIFGRYLRQNGVTERVGTIVEDQITVSEFCERYPTGTYLLLVDSSKKRTPDQKKTGVDHMCCIIDGDLYDSWDSRNAIVTVYYVVPNTPTISEKVDIDDIKEPISDAAESYASIMSHKYEDAALFEFVTFNRTNNYTGYIYLKCYVNGDALRTINSIYFHSEFGHKIIVKISPTFTDADLPRVIKSMNQKIYDWCYNTARDIRDRVAAKAITVNPDYRGDRAKLMRLPEWVRPLVTFFRDDGNPDWQDRFCIFMDALPEDPRALSDPEVSFYADTLSELKSNLESYRKDFRRFGYDY